MPRVRRKEAKGQQMASVGESINEDTVSLLMIQALIPVELRAVEEKLQAQVMALAGARYAHEDSHPGVVRWGRQPGSIFLADQKLPLSVPWVLDRTRRWELELPTYEALQTPRSLDLGLYRRVLGGLSCPEYEAAPKAVPEAFGPKRSSVSRGFIRSSARKLRHLQERPLGNEKWLVLLLDGERHFVTTSW